MLLPVLAHKNISDQVYTEYVSICSLLVALVGVLFVACHQRASGQPLPEPRLRLDPSLASPRVLDSQKIMSGPQQAIVTCLVLPSGMFCVSRTRQKATGSVSLELASAASKST